MLSFTRRHLHSFILAAIFSAEACCITEARQVAWYYTLCAMSNAACIASSCLVPCLQEHATGEAEQELPGERFRYSIMMCLRIYAV